MPHSTRSRQRLRQNGLTAGSFIRAVGQPVVWRAEYDNDEKNIDHFWIDISTGEHGLLQLSLNTYSRNHAVAGFDPEMRVAIIDSKWTELPQLGIFSCSGFSYSDFAASSLSFNIQNRLALEQLLNHKCERASLIEAWGEYYMRGRPGIHQLHSRRASFSVAKDVVGRDGAIRFYFEINRSAELLLFKYAGQV